LESESKKAKPIIRSQAIRVFVLFLALAGCSLPRSGPNYNEIASLEASLAGDFRIVNVTSDVTQKIKVDGSPQYTLSDLNGTSNDLDVLGIGDEVSFSIWENSDEGLFTPQNVQVASVAQVEVGANGSIFFPYLGSVRALGRTPDELRAAINEGLNTLTLSPQVEVRRLSRNSLSISIQGSVARPGIYPLSRWNTHLLEMIALAGGVTAEPQVAAISIHRGSQIGQGWLQDVYDNLALDVPLQSGDTIVVERDRRSFTALGAVSRPGLVQFPKRQLSALEAIGQVAGLNDRIADPTGVFVFRVEDPEIASELLGSEEHPSARRIVYVLDLTKPGGLFVADEFQMRDRDALYVTNSPFTRWQKLLSAVAPAINTADSTISLVGG
jgi:polysaccharide export outer membrane protein